MVSAIQEKRIQGRAFASHWELGLPVKSAPRRREKGTVEAGASRGRASGDGRPWQSSGGVG